MSPIMPLACGFRCPANAFYRRLPMVTSAVTSTWAHVAGDAGLSVVASLCHALAGSLVDEFRDGGDAALEPRRFCAGRGIAGKVEGGSGCVEVAGACVAFSQPRLVERDFPDVRRVVGRQCALEQRFGVGRLPDFDHAAGGHDVDLGAVEPVDPFGLGDAG